MRCRCRAQEERRASLRRYSGAAADDALRQRRQADVDSAIDSRLSALLG
jgi:hypothetical protein